MLCCVPFVLLGLALCANAPPLNSERAIIKPNAIAAIALVHFDILFSLSFCPFKSVKSVRYPHIYVQKEQAYKTVRRDILSRQLLSTSLRYHFTLGLTIVSGNNLSRKIGVKESRFLTCLKTKHNAILALK